MDKDYFNSLKNSVQDSERSVNNVINPTDQTLLTVKVDIDCKVYCDGDFLDLLEANKTKQFTIETGPHLITIESEKYEELVEDREIDAKGRNNLVVVKDMKQKEHEYLQKEEEKDHDNDLKKALEIQVSKSKEQLYGNLFRFSFCTKQFIVACFGKTSRMALRSIVTHKTSLHSVGSIL